MIAYLLKVAFFYNFVLHVLNKIAIMGVEALAHAIFQ